MRVNFIIGISLLYFLALFFPALGQRSVWSKISPPKGVSLGEIHGIAQDQAGFMWLATSVGLHRYDGYRFVSYYHDPDDPNSLAFNRTSALLWSKDGKLWIGTLSKGLDRFDPVTNTFTHFTHDPDDPGTLNSNGITSILEDSQGVVWIGTEKGLHRYHPDTGTFTRYLHNPKDTTSLSHDVVSALFEDRNGHLWVGTGSYWDLSHEKGGLNRFDRRKGTFTRYLHDPDDPSSLFNNRIKAIYEDSRGTFWVGTLGDGLHTMDREKGTFTRHHYDPQQPDKLSRAPLIGKKNDGVTFIHEDVTGAIWIGSQGGVSRYDPKTGRVEHLEIGDVKNSGGEPDIRFYIAHNLKEGLLMIGTLWGNLYRINPLRESFTYQPIGAKVWGMFEDVDGKIWVGTLKGLKIYSQSEGGLPGAIFNKSIPASLSKETVFAIRQDRKGAIWIGGESGLWRRDPLTHAFTLYNHDPKVPTSIGEGWVFDIFEDREGTLWVGTEHGLSRMDPGTGTFTRYHHDPDNPNTLSNPFVWTIVEDQSGNLWVGTYAGLNRLDRKTGTFRHYIERGQFISAIREDASGKLWVSSEVFGLYYYDPQLDDFVRYRDKSTGEYMFDNLRGIVPDDQGNLWVSSSSGLAKLDQKGNLAATYGEETGLNPETFSHAFHKGSNGKIFLGDKTGFYTIQTQEIKLNKHHPQITLTDFRLFDIPVMPGEEGPLGAPLDQIEKIELYHNQNVFTLDFAGIHFTNPAGNRHYFMLENYDDDWRKAGEIPSAAYHKVPPGNYRFRIKAGSSEGVYAEKAISIIIHPPWWQTWWAYGLYAFIGLGLLYSFKQYTVNRERMKHELKIQTFEAEKMHEIDHLKSRFFANISHEFRTPLTLILGHLDKFLARSPEDNPDQPAFLMMQRNARRLQQLINHLLDLSKLEAGSMKLDLKPADLMAFLKTMVLSFTSHAETKEIQYHFKYPSEHLLVYFDADKLEKIITNLLSNAFKFTKPGGKITVTAVLEPADHLLLPDGFRNITPISAAWVLELKVKDSGKGIPEDQLNKIFDRFYQADTSHTREQEGTGIGLSLVRELVELHSGEIKVESQPGHGSCFTVRLPVLLADFEEIAITGPALNFDQKPVNPIMGSGELIPLPDSVSSNSDPEAPLVLIIDDNADVRSFIRENLQAAYQVLEAADGKEGYKLSVKNIPDLILSDVMMPKMDGMELCSKLKTNEKTAHIPVILLTAKASGGDKVEGLETGADDYLIKPFEAAELLVRIKNLIDSRRKLRELFSREITLKPTSITITSVDERFLQRAMLIIEEHIANERFGVEEFGREVGMSKTQLFRKVKSLTNHSPGDFIRIMRLKRAAELLGQEAGSIAEVAFMVGFNDPSYFTKTFHKQYGKTPSEFVAASKVRN
jgi:signal transduction histidine kinase/ligand-binding sensor domain-containing protein/DNA-binding response OmpR family regulator